MWLAQQNRLRICLVFTLIALAATAARAQTADERIDSLIEQAAARLEVVQTPGSGPRVDLTLEDAIARALERNLDLVVQRLNPLVFDLSLAQQLAFYRPTVNANVSNSSRTNPSSTQLDGGEAVVSDTATINGGLDQAVQWGGGNYTVNWNNNRSASTNAFSSFNSNSSQPSREPP